VKYYVDCRPGRKDGVTSEDQDRNSSVKETDTADRQNTKGDRITKNQEPEYRTEKIT
jgi:hypothetical protein